MKITSGISARRISGIAVSVCALLACTLSFAAGDWKVPEATLRFRLSFRSSPTHSSAGYVVRLADGGILPGPYPVTQVFTDGGKELKSYALWYSRETGLYMTFESPGSGSEVDVYVKGAPSLKLWNQSSGITPSAMFCTDSGNDSDQNSESMMKLGSVGKSFRCINRSGTGAANLCISGDLERETGPSCFYMLAYIDAKEAGQHWIAPYIFAGTTKIYVDSQLVSPQKINDKPGGVGQMMNLSKGLHRVDILTYGHGSKEWPRDGMMAFTWKPPKAKPEELGGIRPPDLKYPGTARWESRNMHDSEVAVSGGCKVEEISSKDGSPVPYFSMEDLEIYWFEGEEPIILYRLDARTKGLPEDTLYTWSIDDPVTKLRGKSKTWLFQGRKWHQVTLTVLSGNKTASCTVPFYPYTTKNTTLESASARGAFRQAAMNMFEAFPKDKDPTASWNDSMWRNFSRNMEFGQEPEMMKNLFSRWDDIKSKLKPEDKERLEDMYVSAVTRFDPKGMLDWISRFQKDAQTAPKKTEGIERSGLLELMRAEIYMYYLKDLVTAKKIIAPLIRANDECAEWAKIRMGDVGLLSTNLNEATKWYSEVEDKVKLQTNSAKEKDAAKGKGGKDGQVPRKPAGNIVDVKVDEWKLAVVQEAARSETVMKLIDERFYDEAWAELQRWERNFPMSKINGDYIVREAKLYMALTDYIRPRLMLSAYCEQIEASNYLTLSLKELLTCMEGMKESLDFQKTFCKDVQKRLKGDPICDEIEIMMQSIEGKPAELDKTLMEQIEGGVRIPRKK